MPERVTAQELNIQEQKQDCGCGCGGDSCGNTWQELVWVDSKQLAEVKQLRTSKICYCWTE